MPARDIARSWEAPSTISAASARRSCCTAGARRVFSSRSRQSASSRCCATPCDGESAPHGCARARRRSRATLSTPVPADLGVRAFARPLRVGHPVEDFRRGPPRGLERVERRLDRPVVVQPPREFVLVVAGDRRAGRRRAAAASGSPTSSRCRRGDARSRARTICPGAGCASSSAIGRAGQRVGDRAIAIFVPSTSDLRVACPTCRTSISLVSIGYETTISSWPGRRSRSSHPRVLAIPGAAASCAVRGSRWCAIRCVAQVLERLGRRVGAVEQLEILLGDRAPLRHRLEIEHLVPGTRGRTGRRRSSSTACRSARA